MILHAHRTDNELLRKVRNGNKDCFEVLIRRHTQAMYRIGRMFGFDPRDVEDLITDTHNSAWLRIHEHDGKMPYRIWLTGIMMEKCQIRSRLAEQETLYIESRKEPTAGNQRMPLCAHTRLDVVAAPESSTPVTSVEQLPAALKTVYMLREVEGFSEAETAGLLRISEDAVRLKMTSAKSSLSKSLRKRFFHPDIYPFHASTCDRVVARVLAGI